MRNYQEIVEIQSGGRWTALVGIDIDSEQHVFFIANAT